MKQELYNELQKNYEFMIGEEKKLEKEVKDSLDIFKNSKVPHIDEDMKTFVTLQKEYRKLTKYLKSLKKVLKFNKSRVG